MRKIITISLLACLFATTACASLEDVGMKQGVGTLGGAAAGGLLGSQIGGGTGKLAATAAGTLLGAFLGSEIGSSLDRADQLGLERNTIAALNTQRIGKPSPGAICGPVTKSWSRQPTKASTTAPTARVLRLVPRPKTLHSLLYYRLVGADLRIS